MQNWNRFAHSQQKDFKYGGNSMVYVTRHGQTDWNLYGKVQGKADIELNSRGIEQAKETMAKLKGEAIDFIICSHLKRARQTAEILNSEKNIPIIFDERISERDFGEMEGMSKEDFDFQAFWNYEKNMTYQEAENIREFFNRVFLFLEDIKKKYKDKNILLVTHGGVSIAINCYFKGIPESGECLLLCIKNCEVKSFQF